MFCSSRPRPSELSDTASFGLYTDYYARRVGLSQNKLSVCARMSQSRLNKIVNETIQNVPVKTLVSLCLVLRLNEGTAIDYLARCERAFSPAKPVHQCYLELIRLYSKTEQDYRGVSNEELQAVLNEADDYLIARGFPALPDCNL